MSLKPDLERPILVVGTRRAFDYYVRNEFDAGPFRQPHHVRSIQHMRGRAFLLRDIVWLHDAHTLRDFMEIYRYARCVDSIYDSRDNDESGPLRGRGEAPPHTD